MHSALAKSKNLAIDANALPIYRCKIGGELKPLNHFSLAQRKILNYRCGVDCGMTCKDHTRQQRDEIKCDLCGLWKPYEEFSKNARKNESPSCQRCTAWTEIQEHDVVPIPLETGAISRDEESGEVWRQHRTEGVKEWIEEEGLQACVTDPSSFKLDSEADLNELRLRTGMNQLEVRRDGNNYDQEETRSATSNTTGFSQHGGVPLSISSNFGEPSEARPQKLPPHMLRRAKQTGSEASTTMSAVSSEAGDSSAHESHYSSLGGLNSISTATTLREALAQRSNPVPFNAWATDGIQRQTAKIPTIPSTASITSKGDVTAASFANGASEKSSSFLPEPPINAPPQPKKGWARAEKAPRMPSAVPPVFEPGMDRKTALKFADSDDDEDDYDEW